MMPKTLWKSAEMFRIIEQDCVDSGWKSAGLLCVVSILWLRFVVAKALRKSGGLIELLVLIPDWDARSALGER